MKKLRIILQSKYLYIGIFLLTAIYCCFYFTIPKSSKLEVEGGTYQGIIVEIESEGDLLRLELKGEERIVGNYFFQTEEEKICFLGKYQLGDSVSLKGTFVSPQKNTVPNLFNYQKYLNRKNIYYTMQIDTIEKVKENQSLFYKMKNSILNHIDKYKSKKYLKIFILGNKNLLDEKIVEIYQENGISHLFSLSGMHVSLLSSILLILLKKTHIRENISYLLVVLFLLIYMLLSGCSPSICRAVILFGLLGLNNILHLNIGTLYLFLLTFCSLVVKNPNFLLDIGFQYSFIISFYLIFTQKKISHNHSYWKKLLLVSTLSFVVSLPISIYYFYQLNLASIILNLIFVPMVSIIIFPLSLLTFLFPFLDTIFLIITNLMEQFASFCHHYLFLRLIWMKPSILWILFYYSVFTLYLCFQKRVLLLGIIGLLCYQYFHLIIFPKTFFLMIDVGQGDSLLIHSNNQTMLLDTGGKVTYPKEEWQSRNVKSLTETILFPLLKSLGIRKLDYLVLSHGDYDHCGEALNLIHKIKVKNVILNEGKFNNQEEKIIQLLENKKISYIIAKKNSSYQVGKFKLLSLNSSWNNENDSSIVFLMNVGNYRFLLMGDSSTTVEKKLIEEYNLGQIDFLKVGHHGSNSSTSIEFLNQIKPKIALISVGINNRYHHPSEKVIERLEKLNVISFSTSIFGSIQFNFNKNVTFSINPP